MQAITEGYTRHAVQRCFERGIEPWAVDTVLARGVLVHDAPAGVQVFGLRRLRVVFDPATETVITVYRVRNPKRHIQRRRKAARQQRRMNKFSSVF